MIQLVAITGSILLISELFIVIATSPQNKRFSYLVCVCSEILSGYVSPDWLGGGFDATAKSHHSPRCERHRAGQTARGDTQQHQKTLPTGQWNHVVCLDAAFKWNSSNAHCLCLFRWWHGWSTYWARRFWETCSRVVDHSQVRWWLRHSPVLVGPA